MKTPGWFKRGAATAAVYFLVVPVVGGALVALLALSARPFYPPDLRFSLEAALLGGLFMGGALFSPAALICGIALAFASPKIRRRPVWLALAAAGGAGLTAATALILFRSSIADVLSTVIALLALCIPAAIAHLVAALITLKTRPGPPATPTAEIFA